MGFDVASVRGLYTGLSDGWTYLNAHDTPQVAERVSAGVARSFRTAAAVAARDMAGGHHAQRLAPGTLEGTAFTEGARMAIADLLSVTTDRVVLGPNLPALYQALVRAMKPLLKHSSAVLSRVDDPELAQALAFCCADVRWAQPDLGTGELPAFQYGELVDGSTRLVAFSAAHELLGTVAPVADIVEAVRDKSRAWTLVDATALAAHRPVSFDDLGAHIVGVDLGSMGGPQMAALVFRDTTMFNRLESGHLSERHLSAGLAGGVGPLVDHMATLGLDANARGSRRNRLATSMANLAGYMDALRDELYLLMGTLPAVHIVGVSGEAAAGAAMADRLPRLSFMVSGVPAETVHERLFDNGLVTTLTPMTPLLEEMGVAEAGGAVTVSLSPFNTAQDIENLVRVVASLA